tara:strand:+ start:30 stop:698 length:669 start_codon:yes stop_codon:yes gene_type:complete
MSLLSNFFSSSIGKKFTVATTGILFCFFLLFHLANNFILFAGPEVFNSFVSNLEKIKPVIRLLEFILLSILLLHITNAFILTWKSKKAKNSPNLIKQQKKNSSFVSKTMGFSGSIIFIFIVTHLSTFWYRFQITKDHNSYYNIIMSDSVGFGNIFITILYLIAMIFLGSHLRHGFQSAIQTFGIKNTRLGKILIQVSVIFWFFIPLGFFGIAFWFGIINGLL